MSARSVGVIGLGAMGGAVATRLVQSGQVVRVHDVDARAVERLTALGATADGLRAACAADIVFTSLPNDDILRGVLAEDDVWSALSGGALIELSTILPSTIREIAGTAAEHDVVLVDAPVSGGPQEALTGSLVLLVGGLDEDIDRVEDVLALIGTVERVGEIGNGKALKLVNNVMAVGNMAVAAEAFVLGQRLGLDGARMYDILSHSGGRSHHFIKRTPLILDNDFTARFALRLSEKDLRLTLHTAHEAHHPMPIAAAVHQVYEAALAQGLGDEDMAAVVKVFDGRGSGR